MPFAILLALACGADAPLGAVGADPAGHYALATVGGNPLPALWQETELIGGAQLRAWWVGGRASFCADRTYRIAMTLRTTGPGVLGQPVVVTMSGTWRRLRDGGVEIHPAHGGQVVWRLAGDTLALRARMTSAIGSGPEQATFVFIRRHSLADSAGERLPPASVSRRP